MQEQETKQAKSCLKINIARPYIRRFPLSFIFLFLLFTVSFVNNFKMSSKEKLDSFSMLKGSTLPIVAVNTDGFKPIKSKEDYRRCDAYFVETFTEAMRLREEIVSKKTEAREKDGSEKDEHRARIRGRGNSTWNTFDTNKRSYLLKLDKEKELFALPSARKWILQANVTDKTSLRNAYAYHLGREVFTKAGWAPKTQFVHLFVNGKYLGLYMLMEKAEIAPNRIPLNPDPADESFLAEVNSRLNRAWNFRSDEGVAFSIREKENAKQDYYRKAEETLQKFENVLFSENFTDENTGYRAYIDIESFVDWYIVNEYTKNHDARFQDSCFLTYSSADKKIRMGPIWDFDIACGNNKDECANPEGLFIQSRHWFERLWQDPYFREKVAERWRECRPQIEESFGWIEGEAKKLENDANLDDKIWQRFGYRQWPNAPGYKERKTYRAEVEYMEGWLKKRAAWLDSEW